jgi:ADP-heptose:LPS heptosyltransferase
MCSNTADFIKAIAHAQHVYTCDSSALHVASGYDIPTTCIFTAINPVLRSRYYKNCKSIYIGDEITQNLHESEDPAIIEHVVSRFEAFMKKFKLTHLIGMVLLLVRFASCPGGTA